MTARFTSDVRAVVVQHVEIRNLVVVTEARRWASGHRGAAVTVDERRGADLTAFITQAVVVGAYAIAAVGSARETLGVATAGVERPVAEAGVTPGEQFDTADRAVAPDLRRLFGGEQSARLMRLAATADELACKLEARSSRQLDDLAAQVRRLGAAASAPDSDRGTGWGGYLDEAERDHVALGLVGSVEWLGDRRRGTTAAGRVADEAVAA